MIYNSIHDLFITPKTFDIKKIRSSSKIYYAFVLACWYIQYATPMIMRTIIIPTITGARTFTKKISIAMMIIAAIIVTIIEPALLAILVCILQNINRCYIKYSIQNHISIFMLEINQDLKRAGIAELPNSLPEYAEYIFII